MTEPVIVLVMAAGYSRRFGEDKRWVRLHSGKTVIEQVLVHIADADLGARVALRTNLLSTRFLRWPEH